jgi:nitroreductase
MVRSEEPVFDLEQMIRERHSTRMFLPQPVPRSLMDEALDLAHWAPSNSNIQPWHLVIVSGPPRNRLAEALLEQAHVGPPNIPPLPESFQHYRNWAFKSMGPWESLTAESTIFISNSMIEDQVCAGES